MSRSELVVRLLSELSAARTAIGDSYQRLWPRAEQALDTAASEDRTPPQAEARPATDADDDPG